MIISNWDTNWEFYILFLLYKQNHPYFPLASNKLILAAKHSLSLVFKCSADGEICTRIIDYLPVEYLLYLVYESSYNITKTPLFKPIKVVNQFLVELSRLNWCEHCRQYSYIKPGLTGCAHRMGKYMLSNSRYSQVWIGDDEQIKLYKTIQEYFINMVNTHKKSGDLEGEYCNGIYDKYSPSVIKTMNQREIKQTGNALFCNQLELYITLGNRIQNKYREISWSERKGETWNGGYNINNVLQDNFMIHYYWWEFRDIMLIKNQVRTLQRFC
jgi:hypothetical protein